MLRRLLRTVVLFTIATTVWLVAKPAYASSAAPMCDFRGATVFAPAPTLQAPMASIDLGEEPADCRGLFSDEALQEGRAPSFQLEAPALQATLPGGLVIAAAPRLIVPRPASTRSAPRPGFDLRLDRPPRG